MESSGRERYANQLRMSVGTARNKLAREIMFMLAQKTDMDTCYQCGKKIETSKEMTIEHKTPWLDSEDPYALFFDLNNIAFSHARCNLPRWWCSRERRLWKEEYDKTHSREEYVRKTWQETLIDVYGNELYEAAYKEVVDDTKCGRIGMQLIPDEYKEARKNGTTFDWEKHMDKQRLKSEIRKELKLSIKGADGN